MLVYWEAWQNHIVKSEEKIICNILDLNEKVKTDESKFRSIMTVKCEDEVLNVTNVKWDGHSNSKAP